MNRGFSPGARGAMRTRPGGESFVYEEPNDP